MSDTPSHTTHPATSPATPDGRPPWRIPVEPAGASAASAARPAGGKSFPRKVWGLLVGIKDALALLFLLLFFLALFALLTVRPNAAAASGDGALLLKLNGAVMEQLSEPDPFGSLSGSSGPKEFLTRDIVQALKTAASSSNVKAVVLDLDGFTGGGQASLAQIGEALDTVRAQKPVLAFSTLYDADGYQLAAHASEIWTDPNGGVVAVGPGGSRLYYKDLLDRLGVTANIYRVGTFKSAVEPFLRSDQSPEAKEADLAYATALWAEWQKDVSAARPKAKVADYTQNLGTAVLAAKGDAAQASLTAAMVDKIGGRLAFGKRVAEIAGARDDKRPSDYKSIALNDWVSSHPASTSGDAIAVVPVVGEIVDGVASPGTAGGATISKYILDAVADSNVKALVLRVDSPGGSVLASEEIRQALLTAKDRKLPIVVSMANLAASGGYWVATPADWIIADPATITGSIGVFGILPSFEKSLAKIGVNADGIATTPLSGQPDFLGGVNQEFNTVMQANVENIYGRFTGLVAASRKQPLDKIERIAEGRVWAGTTAKQLGLVDELGDLDRALAAAAKRAKLTSYHAKYFEKKPSTAAMLLASLTQPSDEEAQQVHAGIFGAAAKGQALLQQRLMADIALLTRTGSVQAMCLECRAHQPMTLRSKNALEQGWLMKLALLLR